MRSYMKIFACVECGKQFEAEELPRRGELCFKCHVRGINLGFTYGKEDFHGPTVRERAQKQVEEASANGITAEPIGTRWV